VYVIPYLLIGPVQHPAHKHPNLPIAIAIEIATNTFFKLLHGRINTNSNGKIVKYEAKEYTL